jgi:hypothetical protein
MATGALTRRAARADTQQASIAPAIQLLPAFGLWVGSVCVKHTAGRIIGEPKTSQQPEAAEPQQAALRCCSLAAARTNIGEYKRSSVWLCCTLLPLCISARRAAANAEPIPRTPSAASIRHRRRPLVVPTAGGAEAGKQAATAFLWELTKRGVRYAGRAGGSSRSTRCGNDESERGGVRCCKAPLSFGHIRDHGAGSI